MNNTDAPDPNPVAHSPGAAVSRRRAGYTIAAAGAAAAAQFALGSSPVLAATGTSSNAWADTMAELRTLNGNGTNPKVAVLNGYFAKGDGGGGTFYWLTPAGVDDGGTTIVPSNQTTGCWRRMYSGPVNVRWFGARGNFSPTTQTGNDDTSAFNAATAAAASHQGNADPLVPRGIHVPGGQYLINGPVYVRKGQHLFGDGAGATRVYTKQPPVSGRWIVFVMGKGSSNTADARSIINRAEDAGGLPAVMSDIGIFLAQDVATPATGVFCEVEGYTLRDVWCSGLDLGFDLAGGHGLMTNLQADVGGTGFQLSGYAHNMTNISAFNNEIGMILKNRRDAYHDGSALIKVVNLNVFAPRDTGVRIENGVYPTTTVTFADSQFGLSFPNSPTPNHQGVNGLIDAACSTAAAVVFQGCTFSNPQNHAVRLGNPSQTLPSPTYQFRDCSFDGSRVTNAWAESTNPAAIRTSGCDVQVVDCTFANLKPADAPARGPISVEGSGMVLIKGGSARALRAGTPGLIDVRDATTASVIVDDIDMDGSSALIGPTTLADLAIRGSRRWLGPANDGGATWFWRIPYQHANQWRVTVRANLNPNGDGNYRKSATFHVSKQSGLEAGVKVDKLTWFSPSTATGSMVDVATSNIPAIDVQFGLNDSTTIQAPMSQAGWVHVFIPKVVIAGIPVANFECSVECLTH